MKELKASTQFKKDYKKYRNNPKKVSELYRILELLKNDQPIPDENYPHLLKGKYAGYMECHIESDFLLIWVDLKSNIIKLVRLGSHSELFKN